MARWKHITKLTAEEEKKREAAFEASLIAELSKETKPKTQAHPVPSSPPVKPPVMSTRPSPAPAQAPADLESIYIAVTQHGKTSTYASLAEVPLDVRQKIVNTWLAMQSS